MFVKLIVGVDILYLQKFKRLETEILCFTVLFTLFTPHLGQRGISDGVSG